MDFGPSQINNESLEEPQKNDWPRLIMKVLKNPKKTTGKDSPDNVRTDGFLTSCTSITHFKDEEV
jgi:hypothetical protein